MTTKYDRRSVLRGLALGSGAALMLPLVKLQARQLLGMPPAPFSPDYGPLLPTKDLSTGLELLKLPRGFQYQSFGWTGQLMDDGTPTPGRHDGMAVVQALNDRAQTLVLIRNHEVGIGNVIGAGAAPVYDSFSLPQAGIPGLGGGTTALTFARGRFTGTQATLGGTLTNCAGGATPWGSWLTCEEEILRGSLIGARDHGFVYEVPSPLLGRASARAIEDMGLMKHEACAVDPRTGEVYETEDSSPHSGFYRYRPNNVSKTIGALEQGGALEMLKVVGTPNADLRHIESGAQFCVEWVRVAKPNSNPEALTSPGAGLPAISGAGKSGPYLQGEALGGACFSRLEGCWYQDGVIYFTDTSGGSAGNGVVWAYQPDLHLLTAIYVSPNELAMDSPDNITLSPRGGLVVCEDGGGILRNEGSRLSGTRMLGIKPNGESFVFAENIMQLAGSPGGQPQIPAGDYRGSEFAGACFDPTGRYLFVNIQTPGVTFSITGPWAQGGW